MGQYNSDVSNVGTTAATFLGIGVGARPIAMGGAFVATANDASSMYWNPAGLGRLDAVEILFVHTNWIADMSFEYAGFVIPLGAAGTLGANFTMLDIGEMKVRTIDYPEGTGVYFEAQDIAIGLSYGFNITERFSIGLTAKYISQKIWNENAQSFAIDIGTIYDTMLEGLRIGAALTNFGADMQMTGNDLLVYYDQDPTQTGNNDRVFTELQTNSWPLPLNFQLGLAMDFVQNQRHSLTVALDAVHPIDNTESMNFGVEYGFMGNFFLRAGYRNLFLRDSEEGLTAGAGVRLALLGNFRISVDYAYADFGRLENSQRFTVLLNF
jgi:long-subunit fatty acid transport protein